MATVEVGIVVSEWTADTTLLRTAQPERCYPPSKGEVPPHL